MILKKILKWLYFKLPGSNIYMFHHLTLNPAIDCSGCKLDEQDFYEFIDRHGDYISIEELLKQNSFKRNKKNVITFDDGLIDVYYIAYPYLKSKNIPFTIFILTDLLDTPGYLSKEQLIKMSKDDLVTIAAHGTKHRILTKSSYAEQKEEVVLGKKKLENIINKPVYYFAYSHGQYNEEIIKLVSDAGFKSAFSVVGRPCNYFESKKIYCLPRFNIASYTLNQYK